MSTIASIGYFISNTKLESLKAENTDSVYQDFIEAGKQIGITAFLFSAKDITAKGFIHGYTFDNGIIKSKLYQIPSVIYNRCFGKTRSTEIDVLLKALTPFHTVKFINPVESPVFTNFIDTLNQQIKVFLKTSLFLEPLDKPSKISILLQKDHTAVWSFSGGLVAFKSGGFYPLYQWLLDTMSNGEHTKVCQKLATICRSVGEHLNNINLSFGETVVNFSLQPEGRVLLNNINVMPTKKDFKELKDRVLNRIIKTKPLLFGATLAGHNMEDHPWQHLCSPLQGTFCSENSNQIRVIPIKENGSHIYFRPAIGIMENLGEIESLQKQMPDVDDEYLASSGQKNHCLVYFFSPQNVNKETGKIEGCFYNHSTSCWEIGLFSLPNVVYDRAVFYGNSLELKVAKDVRKYLRSIPILFLNTKSVFGKGKTLEILSNYPEIKAKIPETLYMPDKEQLKEFISNHSYVFVKTEYGSNRRGIFKINSPQKAGFGYELELYDEDSIPCQLSFTGIPDLVDFIWETSPAPLSIVQQGIVVPEYDSSPLNIRVIIQKDITGKWVEPIIVPWVPENAHRAAYCLIWEDIMHSLYSPLLSRQLYQNIVALSCQVALALEYHVGSLGELGIDFITDEMSNLWFLEVNGKGCKNFFIQNESEQVKERVFDNPIGYGKLLAGYSL